MIEGYLLFRFPKFFNDLNTLSTDKNRNVVIMVSISGSNNDLFLIYNINK